MKKILALLVLTAALTSCGTMFGKTYGRIPQEKKADITFDFNTTGPSWLFGLISFSSGEGSDGPHTADFSDVADAKCRAIRKARVAHKVGLESGITYLGIYTPGYTRTIEVWCK